MKINPYLIFNGDCKAAFTFYAAKPARPDRSHDDFR